MHSLVWLAEEEARLAEFLILWSIFSILLDRKSVNTIIIFRACVFVESSCEAREHNSCMQDFGLVTFFVQNDFK